MKKVIVSAAMLAMLAAGCQNEYIVDAEAVLQGEELFTLEINRETDSRTALSGLQTHWTDGDQIYVCGRQGQVHGILTLKDGAGSTNGVFEGYIRGGSSSELQHVIFPAPKNNVIDMASRQPDKLNVPMVGIISSSTNVSLKNVGALIAFESNKQYNAVVETDKGNISSGTYTFDAEEGTLTYEPGESGESAPVYLNGDYAYIPAATFIGKLEVDVFVGKSEKNQVSNVNLKVVDGGAVMSSTEIQILTEGDIYGDEQDEGLPAVFAWDGETIDTEWYGDGTATDFFISRPEEFAGLAELVDGGILFEDKTVHLKANIDLNNKEWNPIGLYGSGSFRGVFDGENYTISNLKLEGQEGEDTGLFGLTEGAVIKNLTIVNANVKGTEWVGVLVGSSNWSKFENVNIKGNVVVEGDRLIGGVVGYVQTTNENKSVFESIEIDVNDGSYVKAGDNVGGVVGYLLSSYEGYNGKVTFSDVTSNITVEGNSSTVGGIVSNTGHQTSFENCSSSATLRITNAGNSNDAETIGGIVGVWRGWDETSVVTLTGCHFEGNIITNIERDLVRFGDLVGCVGPYEGDGLGKLEINGEEYSAYDDFTQINTLLSGDGYTMNKNLYGKSNTSNGNGATGLYVKGCELNGNDKKLWVETNGDWDSAIAINNGRIKNLTIKKGFRGIYVYKNTEQVILENVTFDGTGYTLSCDEGSHGGLKATGCTLKGWTSYAATIGMVEFKDCYFGYGAGYATCRPYAETTFTNCDFEKGFKVEYVGATYTFENCRLNGVALTVENLSELVTDDTKATIK